MKFGEVWLMSIIYEVLKSQAHLWQECKMSNCSMLCLGLYLKIALDGATHYGKNTARHGNEVVGHVMGLGHKFFGKTRHNKSINRVKVSEIS